GSGTKRILRIRIVINELTEVREKIELQEWLRRLRGYNLFSILAKILTVRRRGRGLCSKHKCVFPLLGQSFWIDVWVPNHSRGNERVWHSATSKRKAGEAFVAAIRLTDIDSVAVFFEWPAATGRVTRCVVAKRHVC